MSTRTTYYNLTKPDADEHVLRTVINQNYDAIDLQMHANAQAAEEAAHISADEYDENASYIKGDFCIYENTIYKANKNTSGPFTAADWDATTIADAFEPKHTWTLLDSITADGTVKRYTKDLPANTSGILVFCYFKGTATTTTHARVRISFNNGTTYTGMAYMGSAVTNADRWGRATITKDGNFWSGESELWNSAGGTGNTSKLQNAYVLTNDTITNVQIETTSVYNFESDSTFEIYIRQ